MGLSMESSPESKILTDVDRRSMRFPVAGELRAVELLVSRDKQFDADLIDISAGGICISVAEVPEIEKGQDVFVINRYSVESCVVRWTEETEEGLKIGLQRCYAFPLAELPKKKKKLRTLKSSYCSNSTGTFVFILAVSLFGFAALILGLNLCGARDDLVEWLVMPSQVSTGTHSPVNSATVPDNRQAVKPQRNARTSQKSSRARPSFSSARENSVRREREKNRQFSPDDVFN